MKNRKPTTFVVTIALVIALVMAMGFTGCKKPEPTPAEYTISFVGGEGASGTAPAAQKKKEGETLILPANTFEKADCTFAGWSDGTTTYEAGGEYTVGKKDVTFTAQWAAVEFSVGYAKLESGVTGNVPATVNKKKGDTVELAAAPAKEGSIFVGWNDGNGIFAAGSQYTVNGDVTFAAEWLAEGSYNIGITSGTADIANNKITVHIKESYGSNIYDTEFDFAISGSDVTLTRDAKQYKGTYYNGRIYIVAAVKTGQWTPNSVTVLVFSSEEMTLTEDNGINGYVQPWDFSIQNYFYIFADNTVVYTEAVKTGYQVTDYILKFGTYTKNGKIFTINFVGESEPAEISVTVQGSAFYDYKDVYSGDYKQGTTTVKLDGYGGATIGAEAGSYGVMGTMIYLENVDSGDAGVYAFDKTAKTVGTTNLMSTSSYVLVEDSQKLILYYDGTTVGLMSENEGGKKEYSAYPLTEVGKEMGDNAIFVNIAVDEWFSHTGVAYKKAASVAAGSYVDNIDSTVTASINANTLTLTKGSDTATYTLTLDSNVVTFKPESGSSKSGYYVGGVLYGALAIGGTTQVVALTQTKLATIDGVAAGYVVNSANANQKVYFFKNGMAVYVSGTTGKVGGYTVEENVYTAYYVKDTSATIYGVTLDDDDTAASYTSADKYAGEYKLADGTLKINGFGKWTLGSDAGKYSATSGGLVLYKGEDIYKILAYNQYDTPPLSEATLETRTNWLKESSKQNQTQYLNGLVFSDDVEVYKASVSVVCAKFTYTLNGETKSFVACTGDVVEINGFTFSVGTIDSSQARLTFKIMEGGNEVSKNIVYENPSVEG